VCCKRCKYVNNKRSQYNHLSNRVYPIKETINATGSITKPAFLVDNLYQRYISISPTIINATEAVLINAFI